jgi:hypothetical protein
MVNILEIMTVTLKDDIWQEIVVVTKLPGVTSAPKLRFH